MSSQNKQTNKAASPSYVKPFKTRIIENNVRGKPLDKLTNEQMQANNNPHLSIYNQDFDKGKNVKDLKSNKNATASGTQQNSSPGQIKTNQLPTNTVNPPKEVPTHSQNLAGDKNLVEVKAEKHISADIEKNAAGQNKLDEDAVRADMKKCFLANPNVKVDQEAEYYETVRRLDECGGCWAGQKKYYTSPFQLKQKGPGATLYQKDFVKHPIQKGPVIKNDFYGTFNIEEPMDFATTMRNDFKAWKVEPSQQAHGGRAATSGIPFEGRSGYKAEFIDWGAMPVDFEKAPNSKTVISELPFVGKTAYQENFSNAQSNDRARPLEKSKNKSPLSPGIPFLGETTHSKTYKPYKVGGAPMFATDNEYEATEAYPNQFTSLYKQEFGAPQKGPCPAKVFMETNTHPRITTIKP